MRKVQSVVRDDGLCLADMAVNLSGGGSVSESVSDPWRKRFTNPENE